MHGQQENRDLAALYESVIEEGMLSRAGARIEGLKAGTGQYFKNIGSTVRGQAAPVSAGDAARNAQVQSAYKSAAKGLLTDLQKLGLLPEGPVPPQASTQTVNTLASLVQQVQAQQPNKQPTATDVVPASAPGQPRAAASKKVKQAPQPVAPQPVAAAPIPKLAQPKAAPAATNTPSGVKNGTQIGDFTFDGTNWLTKDGKPVSGDTADSLSQNALQGNIGPAAVKPKKTKKTPVASGKSRKSRVKSKASKAEANEEFAFSSNLPFKKFFPGNRS
jgi:hypothetical protein